MNKITEPKISFLLFIAGIGIIIFGIVLTIGFILSLKEPTEEINLGALRDSKISAIQDTYTESKDGEVLDYTDDNTGENFVIKGDGLNYTGLGGSVLVHFSITNVSETNQIADVVFSFGENKDVRYVKRYVRDEIVSPEQIIPSVTTTDRVIPAVYEEVWNDMTLSAPKIKAGIERKSITDKVSKNGFTDTFNAGETKYYRASVLTPAEADNTAPFFIEVFGEKGSYGHLDPTGVSLGGSMESLLGAAWGYEQNFNALSTADLNGQDSWSGNVAYDVTSTVAYEGAKGVGVSSAVDDNIQRNSGASADSGNIYIAMKSTYSSGGDPYTMMFSDATQTMHWILRPGNDAAYYANSAYQTLDASYQANTWYVFNIRWDDAANPDDFDARVREEGGEWSAWGGYLPAENTYSGVNIIRFYTGKDGNGANYWDTITLTDPTPAPATASSPNIQTIFLEG